MPSPSRWAGAGSTSPRAGWSSTTAAAPTDRSADTADVDLTERECGLLAVLASRPNRVFTRAELLERVFDGESPGAVDTYVSYLRRKLGKDAVVTVHGLGYRRGTA